MTKKSLKKKFNDAVNLEKKGRHSDALKIYQAIIKDDPKNREACLNTGSIYSRMNKYEDAMYYYEKALSILKDYITYFNVGCIHYKQINYKKAVINLEKSKNLNAGFILSSLVLGLCFSRMNDYKAAETNFADVLKIIPGNRVALTALTILYYNQDKFSKAIKLLNSILEIDSSNVKMLELKSNILYKTGKIDESVNEIKSLKKISHGYRYYDEFIKSVPVESYTDRYGTLDEKIDFLRKNTKEDNESLISLSLCHLFKGETDLAIDYLFRVKKGLIN